MSYNWSMALIENMFVTLCAPSLIVGHRKGITSLEFTHFQQMRK
jgi:hypothetical protein